MGMRNAECGMWNGRRRLGMLAVAALLLLQPGAARAQIGHAPEGSPYRDLRAKQAASFIGGFLRGQRGKPRAAPSDGPVVGLRYDRQIGSAVEVLIGISGARLDKYIIDPTVAPEFRATGPVKDDVVFMETGMSLLITGRKSWRGFVPYIGGMVGVVFETGLGTLSQFNFGTRVAVTPHVGFKWYPVQALAFKVEARDVLWRVKYPEAWFSTQVAGIPPVLVAGTHNGTEWLHHPTLMVSLGYTFTF